MFTAITTFSENSQKVTLTSSPLMPSLPCSPFCPSGPWDPCDPCGPCTPMLPWSPCVKWKWTPTLRPRTTSNVFSQSFSLSIVVHRKCIASWKALLSVLPAVLQVTQRHFAQSRTRPYQLQITCCCNLQHWKQLRSYVHFQLTMQQQKQNSTLVHDKLKGYVACVTI